MVGADHVADVAPAHQLAAEREGVVRLLVGLLDVALTDLHPAVRTSSFVTSSKYGFGLPSMSFGVVSAMN